MTFDELLAQVVELLQRQGRVSYGALKRRFALDDAYLQDLKDEIIDAQRIAVDEDGKVLVWQGGTDKAETEKRRNGETEKDNPTVAGGQLSVANPRPLAPSPQHPDAPRSTRSRRRAAAVDRDVH